MAHGDNLAARLQKETKNPAATLLLLRLLYWHHNGKGRMLKGEKWVTNSLSHWAQETSLSIQQVRTAFKVVEDEHLVETRVEVWRTRPTLHARPTQRLEAIAAGKKAELEAKLPSYPQHGTLLPATLANVAGNTGKCVQQHALQGEIQGEKQGVECTGAIIPDGMIPQEGFHPKQGDPGEEDCNDPEIGKDEGEPCQAVEENTPATTPKQIGEIAMKMDEALKAGKAKAILHKPDTASALEFLWKKTIGEKEGGFVAFKAKERGQLGQFRKLCPTGQSEAILAFILGHWVEFTAKVESETGKKGTPAKPQVGFLLQYAGTAVMYATALHSISKSTAKKHEASPVPTPTKSLQLAAASEPPATLDEMAALMKEIQDDG